MCSVVWLGIYFYYKRTKIKQLLFFALAASFHSLAFVFVPISFLLKYRVNLLKGIFILVFAYFLGQKTLDFIQNINVVISLYSNRLSFYLTDYYGEEVEKYNIGLGFILYVIIFALISVFNDAFNNKKQLLFFNHILFLGITTILLFISISIFTERIANLLLISLVFIFSSIKYFNPKNSYRFFIFIFIVIVNLFYFVKISHLPGINREYQFLPYSISL
jgi:hypothetical protein